MARRLQVPALLLFLAAATTACSDDGSGQAAPTILTADDITCDEDFSTDLAKDTVERVGGLQTDEFTVKFAEGTRLGVVALVEGDVRHAFAVLHRRYGVALVAPSEDHDEDHVTGFDQVRELVEHICP
jgi:hypothetical protein